MNSRCLPEITSTTVNEFKGYAKMKTRMKIRNKYGPSEMIAGALVLAGILFAIVFWPKAYSKSTQEWLTEFAAGLAAAGDMTDKDGNMAQTNVVREIKITENAAVVAVYKQQLRVTTTKGRVEAYLMIEEKYPTLATTDDDITDEYYFANDVMHTRRLHGADSQISRFDSELSVLLTVVSENMGGAKYDFDEANFGPAAEGGEIIRHDDGKHILDAKIKSERYAQFFGNGTSVEGLSNAEIRMTMTDKQFESLTISYVDGGLHTKISMTRFGIQPITAPEWA